MQGVVALSLIGAMCCIGVLLRRWVPLFRNFLVPAIVIGGILGMILMNLGAGSLFDGVGTASGGDVTIDGDLFGTITTELFTLTFTSIGLTAAPPSPADNRVKQTRQRWRRFIPQSPLVRGALAMGLAWSLLWTIQEIVGLGLGSVLGSFFGMPAEYGLMAAFAFAQGPGQAATFGAVFEGQGWEDTVNVGLTFAALGYLAAFVVGVPLARGGLKSGAAARGGGISESAKRGILSKEEQTTSLGQETTHSGNIESLGLALALVGVCYLGAIGLAEVYSLIPGFFGETMSGLMFMNGLFVAYIFRWALNRLGAGHLLNADAQRRLTGLFSDFTVVSAFMAVQVAVVLERIVPILVIAVVVSLVTLLISVYLGRRFGSDHDFERTVGIFGAGTGTVPTGLSLIRIVDPQLRTTAGAEMGLMEVSQMMYLPAMFVVSAVFADSLTPVVGVVILVVLLLINALMSYGAGDFSRKTFTLKPSARSDGDIADAPGTPDAATEPERTTIYSREK